MEILIISFFFASAISGSLGVISLNRPRTIAEQAYNTMVFWTMVFGWTGTILYAVKYFS